MELCHIVRGLPRKWRCRKRCIVEAGHVKAGHVKLLSVNNLEVLDRDLKTKISKHF